MASRYAVPRYSQSTVNKPNLYPQVLLPGPRNSVLQNNSLIACAKCIKVVFAAEMNRVVDGIKHDSAKRISFLEIQSLDHILSASAPQFAFERRFFDVVKKPAIIVHSSGSTGE